MNPYHVLGIDSNAGDREVRQAYLALTAHYPPDRFPDRFSRIREAWEMLKDETARARFKLFSTGGIAGSPMGVVAAHERDKPHRTPPTHKDLLKLLRGCLKDSVQGSRA